MITGDDMGLELRLCDGVLFSYGSGRDGGAATGEALRVTTPLRSLLVS